MHSELIVRVPNITGQGIGSLLNRPGCHGQLVPEQVLVKGISVGLQEAQVVQ